MKVISRTEKAIQEANRRHTDKLIFISAKSFRIHSFVTYPRVRKYVVCTVRTYVLVRVVKTNINLLLPFALLAG